MQLDDQLATLDDELFAAHQLLPFRVVLQAMRLFFSVTQGESGLSNQTEKGVKGGIRNYDTNKTKKRR
jgi:hypothetical protein